MEQKKVKNRHNPDKPQNNYGGDYNCENYDCLSDGTEFCHDETNVGFDEDIKWSQTDDGKLKCNGNRHNCFSLKLKWFASLSQEEKNKYSNDIK